LNAPELRVVDDPFAACLGEFLAAVQVGPVFLSGGSTPKAVYEQAARSSEAFSGAQLWFGDERCVPPDDERSNYLMAKRALLDPLADAGVDVDLRRIEGERGPELAALTYQRSLQDADALPGALVLLGIGPDGHTASMFPGQESVSESQRLVVGVPEAGLEPWVPRVTLTFAALAQAARVIVLAVGAGKAGPVARAFGPHAVPSAEVPSSLLPGVARSLLVILDSAAAGEL
jgi:6-phosphogluconolactonase